MIDCDATLFFGSPQHAVSEEFFGFKGTLPPMPTNRAGSDRPSKQARRLVALMDIHGITTGDLAKALGLSPASVSQWKSGTTKPSATNYERIAKLLGEDLEFVMALSDRGTKGWGAVLARGEDRLAESLAGFDDAEIDEILEELAKIVQKKRADRDTAGE